MKLKNIARLAPRKGQAETYGYIVVPKRKTGKFDIFDKPLPGFRQQEIFREVAFEFFFTLWPCKSKTMSKLFLTMVIK